MKKQSTHKQPAILLLLVLLGMSVLVYQTAHTYVQSNLKVLASTQDVSSPDQGDPAEVLSVNQDVFLSVSTIQIDLELHQIKEIVFGDDKKEKHTHIITKYVSSFFKTLFEQVISPNAP